MASLALDGQDGRTPGSSASPDLTAIVGIGRDRLPSNLIDACFGAVFSY